MAIGLDRDGIGDERIVRSAQSEGRLLLALDVDRSAEVALMMTVASAIMRIVSSAMAAEPRCKSIFRDCASRRSPLAGRLSGRRPLPATDGAGSPMPIQGNWPAETSRLMTAKRDTQSTWSSKVDVATGWLQKVALPKVCCEVRSLPTE